jgi:hypothetical protein
MLAEIPEGLFANNTKVTSFMGCFNNCVNIKEIPEGFFANNTEVRDYSKCFYGCSQLTGSAPNLWFKLNVIEYEDCFYGCTKLSNYEEIPDDWK